MQIDFADTNNFLALAGLVFSLVCAVVNGIAAWHWRRIHWRRFILTAAFGAGVVGAIIYYRVIYVNPGDALVLGRFFNIGLLAITSLSPALVRTVENQRSGADYEARLKETEKMLAAVRQDLNMQQTNNKSILRANERLEKENERLEAKIFALDEQLRAALKRITAMEAELRLRGSGNSG
jgi:hypothetical protein